MKHTGFQIEARSVGHLQKLNTGLENKIIELQMRLDIAVSHFEFEHFNKEVSLDDDF